MALAKAFFFLLLAIWLHKGCSLQCPPLPKLWTHNVTGNLAKVYNAYAESKCELDADNWFKLYPDEHQIIARDIFEAIGAKSTDYIFDWGSGCGTKLRYLETHIGGSGFGIDISSRGVRWSQRRSTRSTFCLADGTNLTWLPTDHFHHVISFGALSLLYSSRASYGEDMLCAVIDELCRITKPSGCVFLVNCTGLLEVYNH